MRGLFLLCCFVRNLWVGVFTVRAIPRRLFDRGFFGTRTTRTRCGFAFRRLNQPCIFLGCWRFDHVRLSPFAGIYGAWRLRLLGLLGLLRLALTVIAVFDLAIALFTLLLFAACVLFTLRFTQKADVMLGVLLKVFCSDTIIRQLCIPRQLQIFINDLLRCSAHFSFGARAVKNSVDDISRGTAAVRF